MSDEQLTRRTDKAHLRFWLRVFVVQLLVLLGALSGTQAQVANDDIEHRRVLRPNQTVNSNTTGSTVQWAAVDEKLTGKCIEYHNDQWFEFTPRTAGRYYVNISGQQCRDTRGVQLVVLTGTPGRPETYQILSCNSLGSQDDVFVALEGLQAGRPYLLDVDGYLKDFCEFNLAVSQKPRGVPAAAPPSVAAAIPATSKVVQLQWSLADSLGAVRQFRVLRREAAEFRASPKAVVAVGRTTYGTTGQGYAWTDTLASPGRYLYQVIAEFPDATAPVLVVQQWYAYSQLMPEPSYFSGAAAQSAQRAAKAQQSSERRSHRARLKRLAGLRRHSNSY